MLIAEKTVADIEKLLQYIAMYDKAYPIILLGEKGIGKRLVAENIAKEILETESLSTCPDYMVVEAENGSILIDHLNELKRRTLFCAAGKYKVFVIDDADTMHEFSQNSLLKILEDGNETNIFIFVAHKPLLDTIHSRCVTLHVNTPDPYEVAAYFESNNMEYDRVLMEIADYRIGLYFSLIKDEKFVEDCKAIIHKMQYLKNSREILEAFGLVKENSSFYELYGPEKVLLFFKFLKEHFVTLLYDLFGVEESLFANLKKLFDFDKCIKIIELIENHTQRMMYKGQYTKNDFFDLIRYMI